ncbi:MAG: 30S ribosomal protein S4 [bacterium]
MSNPDLKCRKCRRAGEKLFLKGERCNTPKCAFAKRNTVPGVHGPTAMRKLTAYGKQLQEKQKAKRIYGLREKQFYLYYVKALKQVGNTAEIIFGMLENRLDNTVFRLGLASSRTKARQIVNHGHILVNGKKIDIPSYQVAIGDVVSIRETSAKKKLFENVAENIAKNPINAPWLTIDAKTLQGKVTGTPKFGDVEMNIGWPVIIEFYSK